MNRTERRRVDRELAQSMKRARLESAAVTASCGWPSCRKPVASGMATLDLASDALKLHYEAEHGGREPQPIEGACLRCKRHTSWVPGEVLMLCADCRQAEGVG